jgi:putative ABC transport system ATP-binding protein
MDAEPLTATCRGVVQIYESSAGPVQALKGLSLDVRAGAVTAVIGPSGAGKSTLLRLLACLESPTVGEVTIAGTPTSGISRRARRRLAAERVGYVFQTPGDNLMHDLTVDEHVRLASRMRGVRREDVGALLEAVELAHVGSARPSDLAAGEQQRLALAMAVAGQPDLVVADEPTASLDPRSAHQLADLFPGLTADGRSLVVSTHDPVIIAAADHVLVIRNGVLAMEGRRGEGRLSVIDDADRLALPDVADGLFPEGRARVTPRPGHLRVDRP